MSEALSSSPGRSEEENYEQNVDRAWHMALSEQPLREKAKILESLGFPDQAAFILSLAGKAAETAGEQYDSDHQAVGELIKTALIAGTAPIVSKDNPHTSPVLLVEAARRILYKRDNQGQMVPQIPGLEIVVHNNISIITYRSPMAHL